MGLIGLSHGQVGILMASRTGSVPSSIMNSSSIQNCIDHKQIHRRFPVCLGVFEMNQAEFLESNSDSNKVYMSHPHLIQYRLVAELSKLLDN
jgi:hypothetical protein